MAPIVKTLPFYSKDSQHALEIFRDFNFLGQNQLILTMDITSLYTVIPNDEGLRALKHFFDQRTVKEPSSETLLRLAELVLTLNCFSFGGNYYKQTNGVATTVPNKSINRQHYKRPRRRTLTAFHVLLHFTLTTTQLNLSFLKILNYSKTIQRLALSFRNPHLFHSNVTKT